MSIRLKLEKDTGETRRRACLAQGLLPGEGRGRVSTCLYTWGFLGKDFQSINTQQNLKIFQTKMKPGEYLLARLGQSCHLVWFVLGRSYFSDQEHICRASWSKHHYQFTAHASNPLGLDLRPRWGSPEYFRQKQIASQNQQDVRSLTGLDEWASIPSGMLIPKAVSKSPKKLLPHTESKTTEI